MMKYELGVFDACAKAHGDSLISEAKNYFTEDDMRLGSLHSVVVCVYADGFLQFAGGNTGWIGKDEKLTRASVKREAFEIVRRMGAMGYIDKKEAAK